MKAKPNPKQQIEALGDNLVKFVRLYEKEAEENKELRKGIEKAIATLGHKTRCVTKSELSVCWAFCDVATLLENILSRTVRDK